MIEEKIKELGFQLPDPPKPLAAYVPAVICDKLVYTSGQIAMLNGELKFKGKVGGELTIEEGANAAQLCALNCLSVIKDKVGSLDNIERIIKVTVFVSSAEGFTDQPKVANGASELLAEIFGDAGKHVRSAVGVVELPIGSAVEIEVIAKLK
ncbi:MAG: RidA family protein [Ignavibacteriae bacterium]|jgi:enamine deaminase RidA (YjgF/YER057c/UK114 family)|nr:RidA family protein [Ignavibacteriota bacterium]NOG96714.1 RidA family protein [Ignavibacteriota bacterium]